jgi:rubrerythrin
MANFFHANEIAKAAVEIERKGYAFYRKVAELAQNDETRQLFEYLAGEEHKHEAIFQSLYDRLGEIELPAWSTQDEYGEYLDALITSHALFTSGLAEKYMSQAQDEDTAIRMAMAFEKDTILFFMEMRELTPDSEKAAVQQCIDEERLHLRRLRAMQQKKK